MFLKKSVISSAVLLAANVALLPTSANAALSLTSDGINQGFTLSTVVSGFSNSLGIGPIGTTIDPSGHLLISNGSDGRLYSFTDADNQTVSNNLGVSTTQYSFPGGLVTVGNNIYLAVQGDNEVYKVDGTGNIVNPVAHIFGATSIVYDAFTGHLFVSGANAPVSSASSGVIFDLDPATGAFTSFKTAANGTFYDGLSLSADGHTLYAADRSGFFGVDVVGFDTATGSQVFQTASIPGADGIVEGTGTLAGNLFVNTNTVLTNNDGTVVEVNLATGQQTIIASGGSRGDFVTVDPTNNTLLLTQTDSVLRLIPSSGGGFTGGTSVPVPAAVWLFGSALAGLGLTDRRKKA